MGFSDAMDNAMATLFGDDFADQVTQNSVPVNAHVIEQGQDSDENSIFDFIEVEFQSSGYASIAYRSDTLVYDSITWRYPRLVSVDGTRTKTVRFVNNQRPKHRR